MCGSENYTNIDESLQIGPNIIDTKLRSSRNSPINRAPEGQTFNENISTQMHSKYFVRNTEI